MNNQAFQYIREDRWHDLKLDMVPNPYRGKLIVFDGIDGSGKTTHINFASTLLTDNHCPHIVTKSPSDDLRKSWYWQAWHHGSYHVDRQELDALGINLMGLGDRLVHQANVIKYHLSRGEWVICDRSFLTSFVYDENYLLQPFASKIIRPDIGIVLKVNADIAFERLNKRSGEDFHPHDFWEKPILNYRYALLSKTNGFTIIDTSTLTLEESLLSIKNQILPLLFKEE